MRWTPQELHAFSLEVDSWRQAPYSLNLPPRSELSLRDCLLACRQAYNRDLLNPGKTADLAELKSRLQPLSESWRGVDHVLLLDCPSAHCSLSPPLPTVVSAPPWDAADQF